VHLENLSRVLAIRERELRKNFEAEFNARLKAEIVQNEAELAAKRSDIERHIIKQTKKMFG